MFLGFINLKRESCFCFTKYSDHCAFFLCFFVDRQWCTSPPRVLLRPTHSCTDQSPLNECLWTEICFILNLNHFSHVFYEQRGGKTHRLCFCWIEISRSLDHSSINQGISSPWYEDKPRTELKKPHCGTNQVVCCFISQEEPNCRKALMQKAFFSRKNTWNDINASCFLIFWSVMLLSVALRTVFVYTRIKLSDTELNVS